MALFNKKKKELKEDIKKVENSTTEIITTDTLDTNVQDEDMAKDLASLVNESITVWVKKYHLENLPRDIILDQVIGILETYRNLLNW